MTVAFAILLSTVVASGDADTLEPTPHPPMPPDVRTILEQNCVGCHSTEDANGGVDVSIAHNAVDVYRQGRTWNKVIRAARDRQMPPASEAQPSDAERQRLIEWVQSSIRSVACDAPPDPGWVTVRRLNRVEYQNTIRDLFGLDVDAGKDLPSDPAGDGFDNQGDTLFIPPVLMEKYLDTTKRILSSVFADPAARGRLLRVLPDPAVPIRETIQANVEPLLFLAFRRPPEASEVQERVRLVESSLARGKSFEEAMAVGATSILLSPHFLFRIEGDRADPGNSKSFRITDFELATRLSYFLWSTMPDQELFDFARLGRLHEPEILYVQVERMLADPKSVALAEDFAAQWFGFRDLRTHEMDVRRFGKFNGLRESMYYESRTFFDSLFRENRPLLDVLDCNYGYWNESLANHYGLSGVSGGEIRKVEISDRRRGGVLGMGSTLVVTSYATRTSPVLRGKWVLEQLFGTPAPPPPPNTPALSKDDQIKDGLTLRQRFELHRRDANCASCHARMDPLGFALENFDGIGEWRDKDNELPIDNSASLADGTVFHGPEGLKDVLLAKKEMFLRHFVEKMFIYALGRAVDYYDECTIQTVMDRLASSEFASHEVIHAIVESHAFTHRGNSHPQGADNGG